MCQTPNRIEVDGEPVEVACHKCWMCRLNRVNDYIGRAIGESLYSDHVLALTLTYRPGEVGAALLQYSDVQKFLKRLRARGYSVRYLCAGEYGSKKGRAHWHILLFFQGSAPDLTLEWRQEWDAWPHGLVYPQAPDYGGFAYLLKYVLKDEGQLVHRRHLALSKKPVLGYAMIENMAREQVVAGVPLNLSYSFGDVLDRKGRPRRFRLRGAGAELMAARYFELWEEIRGPVPWLYDGSGDALPQTKRLWKEWLRACELEDARKGPVHALRDPERFRAAQRRRKRIEPDPEPASLLRIIDGQPVVELEDGTWRVNAGLSGLELLRRAGVEDAEALRLLRRLG